MIELFKELMKDVEKPIVFELGAHMGEHTKQLADAIKEKDFKLHAFEPLTECIPILQYNTEEFKEKVKIWNFAIGDKDDNDVDFWIGKDKYAASSSIHKPKEVLEIWKDMEFTKVKTRTIRLDTVLHTESIDHIDFVWADIQGAEIDMIRGGSNFLKKVKYLYTEYNTHELYDGTILLGDLLAALPDFEVEKIWKYDVLLRNKNIQ